MSLGKPLVATEIAGSGVSWVNQHGLTGLNVPVLSPEALAGALTSIVHNPGLAQIFGQAARKRYEDEFTATLMTRRTIDFYQRLMAR